MDWPAPARDANGLSQHFSRKLTQTKLLSEAKPTTRAATVPRKSQLRARCTLKFATSKFWAAVSRQPWNLLGAHASPQSRADDRVAHP